MLDFFPIAGHLYNREPAQRNTVFLILTKENDELSVWLQFDLVLMRGSALVMDLTKHSIFEDF